MDAEAPRRARHAGELVEVGRERLAQPAHRLGPLVSQQGPELGAGEGRGPLAVAAEEAGERDPLVFDMVAVDRTGGGDALRLARLEVGGTEPLGAGTLAAGRAADSRRRRDRAGLERLPGPVPDSEEVRAERVAEVAAGAQLAGVPGALLGIPFAGALKVVSGELLAWRRGEDPPA